MMKPDFGKSSFSIAMLRLDFTPQGFIIAMLKPCIALSPLRIALRGAKMAIPNARKALLKEIFAVFPSKIAFSGRASRVATHHRPG
jgi:hypothetical protein